LASTKHQLEKYSSLSDYMVVCLPIYPGICLHKRRTSSSKKEKKAKKKKRRHLLKIYFVHLKLGFKNSWCQNSASEKILGIKEKSSIQHRYFLILHTSSNRNRKPFTQCWQYTLYCKNREQSVMKLHLRFLSWKRVHTYGCAQLLKHIYFHKQVVSAKLGKEGNIYRPLQANASIPNSTEPSLEIRCWIHWSQWDRGTTGSLNYHQTIPKPRSSVSLPQLCSAWLLQEVSMSQNFPFSVSKNWEFNHSNLLRTGLFKDKIWNFL